MRRPAPPFLELSFYFNDRAEADAFAGLIMELLQAGATFAGQGHVHRRYEQDGANFAGITDKILEPVEIKSTSGFQQSVNSSNFRLIQVDMIGAAGIVRKTCDDLAALRGAGYAQEEVVVYLQDQGAFSTTITLTPTTGGYLPHSLTLGDVNSDGRDDLVVTAGGNTPNAYLNVFLQGDAGLAAQPISYTAYHLPSAVAVADINHDGREDVIAVHDAWRTLSVYTQTAELKLAPYASMDIPYSSRYRPNAMTLADFDGNGSLDGGSERPCGGSAR